MPNFFRGRQAPKARERFSEGREEKLDKAMLKVR
jgi:hypothetical protein